MKLLSNQINPHFKLIDSLHAVSALLVGPGHKKLNQELEETFGTANVVFTNTARTALGLICDTVELHPQKKIGLPAFICAVVATPFLSRGYEIEWIDTDDNGLIDPDDFAQKTAGISLVVVPHVFGQLAPLKKIKDLAEPYNIFVVEDGAHAIRQFLPGFKTLADAQILSFGREKVVSCVSGGALIWPEKSDYHASFLALKKTLKSPSIGWVVSHALQPLIFCVSLPWWFKGGKIIPWLAQKLKILPLAVTAAEKKGQEDIPLRALGLTQKRILNRQIKLCDWRTVHAQALALAWQEVFHTHFPEADCLIPRNAFRTIIRFKAPHYKEDLIHQLKANQAPYHLEDWAGVPISPKGVSYKSFGYRPGQCKNAEYYARTYLTLPTNIRTQKADVKAFANYLKPA